MQREQTLKKYLSVLPTLPSQKFKELTKRFAVCGKEYEKQNDQVGLLKVLKSDLQKNKRNRNKELIRYIYIFDTLIKDVKSYRQPISLIIAQIYVQLFSIFFENNLQTEIQDMKMIRKSWATLIPDHIIQKLQKQILKTHNYNLDKGFSKKKIQELAKYYSTIKLTPEIYNKYLPSRQNSKTNDMLVQQFQETSNQDPIARRRKPINQMPTSLPQNIPTVQHQPLHQQNTYQHQPQNQYGSYQNNPFMYQMPMQYNQMPMQQVQPMQTHQQIQQMTQMTQIPQMQQMQPVQPIPMGTPIYQNPPLQPKNPQYYYPPNSHNNMHIPMAGSYIPYQNHMNMHPMNVAPAMTSYKPPVQEYENRYQQSKVQDFSQNNQRKGVINSKYKQLISFGRYRCPCCGMVSNKKNYFDLHLKSHFQQSKKEYENQKKQAPLKRTPALNVKQWLPKESDDDGMNCFVQMSKYPQNRCKLCSNIFQPTWDSNQQKWIFKDVVLVQLDNTQCSMHYPCFAALNDEAKMK